MTESDDNNLDQEQQDNNENQTKVTTTGTSTMTMGTTRTPKTTRRGTGTTPARHPGNTAPPTSAVSHAHGAERCYGSAEPCTFVRFFGRLSPAKEAPLVLGRGVQ